MREALCVVVGYVVGGIPTGLLLVRQLHPEVDLRSVGSGNVGTSNIFRNVGAGPAVAVGPLQFAQGLFPLLLARWAEVGPAALAAVAVAAVCGSAYPAWAGFNGGRGVAVATGAVAGLGWLGLTALLALYAGGLLVGEIAVGVLAGFVVLPAVELLSLGGPQAVAALCLLAIVVLRRLQGLGADVAAGHPRREVLAMRLLRDQRPGRPLVGPRTERRP